MTVQEAYDVWECPNCGECYEVDYDDYDYCSNCGQVIYKSQYLMRKKVEQANREAKFNILRGCVIGSYLERKEKQEILEFVNELEEPQDWNKIGTRLERRWNK